MEYDVKVESKSVLYTQGSIWSHLSQNSCSLLQDSTDISYSRGSQKSNKCSEEFRCPLQIKKQH